MRTLCYVASADLGREVDYSALLVLEVLRERPLASRYYQVRHGHRWPLGTPYTQIAAEIDVLIARPPLTEDGTLRCSLVIDETGVGVAVADIIRARRPAVGITLHGGYRYSRDEDPDRERYRVPKADLIGVAVRVLQEERLAIATSPALEVLEAELRAFTRRTSPHGAVDFGPLVEREGEHDDMVLALAQALWYVEVRGAPGTLPDEQPEPYMRLTPEFRELFGVP